MRIDTHQHYWRYRPEDFPWIDDRLSSLKRDFGPDDVRPLMTAAGFDAAIAVQARQTDDETSALLAFADRSFVAGVVGWVDLQADDVAARLEAVVHPKLVGIRHIVQDEADDRFLLRPAFGRGIALLRDFDLTYDVLVYPRHLPVVVEFLGRFPAQRFVLDHLAKPEIRHGRLEAWARDFEAVAACPNVVAKVSGLVTEASWTDWTTEELTPYLDVALDVFGADRLMVGSDWPVCTLAASYERTMAVVDTYLAGRPARAREAMLGGTAARVWKLTEPLEQEEH